LLTGDFNGDGRPDLATTNGGSGDVTVLLGVGDGAFREAGRFAVGGDPYALLTGDFNGDGRPDLATANRSSGDVTVLLAWGTGRSGTRAASPWGGPLCPADGRLQRRRPPRPGHRQQLLR
jgi:hypothetical protein